MGKTVAQLGELIQRLVENGIIRSDTNLNVDDYSDLVLAARDYLLYQRKVNNLGLVNSQVVSKPKDYPIKDGKVIWESGFCIQGIDGAILLNAGGEEMCDLINPISPSSSALICDSIFSYYIPNTEYCSFKNLPRKAKQLRVFSIAGSSMDDVVSEDLAFMIIQQVFKLGQSSDAQKTDSSADGNNLTDDIKSQIRQLINQPNAIA